VRIEVFIEGDWLASDGEDVNISAFLQQTNAARKKYACLEKGGRVRVGQIEDKKDEDEVDDGEENGVGGGSRT
jgi:hypothetical protein